MLKVTYFDGSQKSFRFAASDMPFMQSYFALNIDVASTEVTV
jgi:hypothetical protein